ncbi:hypothetical protein MVF7_02980 [Staphylococcus aureus]|nr:hypothetical protein MVF7_02980 [Staphylococcus aureus]
MQCKRRENKEFTESTQYMKIKKSKLSINGSEIKGSMSNWTDAFNIGS